MHRIRIVQRSVILKKRRTHEKRMLLDDDEWKHSERNTLLSIKLVLKTRATSQLGHVTHQAVYRTYSITLLQAGITLYTKRTTTTLKN
jgi:hypothetical protein